MQGSDYDGPGGYILQYSTDGTHFTNFGSSYAVPTMQPFEEYTTQLWGSSRTQRCRYPANLAWISRS